jgi:rhombotail lipoprotein
MDFLYPNKENRTEHKTEIPVLKLPVKVGLAFVPSKNWQRG